MMIEPKKAGVIIVIIFTVIFVVSFAYSKIIKKAREDIIISLRSDIKKTVKNELETYLQAKAEIDRHEVLSVNKAAPEVKENARQSSLIGRDQNIRELVKIELDKYVSGAAKQETPVMEGFNKEIEKSVLPSGASGNILKGEDTPAGATKEQSIERTLIEKGGMLLPKGKLQYDTRFSFAHFSSNRINIEGFAILPVLVIGEISTEKVNRDIFVQTAAFKYGILNNFQGDIKVPYRYEFDRFVDTQSKEKTRQASGLGDIEFVLSRQLFWEHKAWPDLLLSLGVKTPTGKSPYNRDIGLGTGHWGARGALIAAKASDPAVVFGSVSYSWNFARQIDDFGKVQPGYSIGYSLGTAIALSYQTAINFQFEHSVTSKMKKDGIQVNGSFLNSASLKSGFNWAVSEKLSVDFSVSHGLTTDSPDYVVEIGFPFTF